MPTFRDVGISSTLRAGLREKVSPPISTPLALLSRDAAATAKELQIPLQLMKQLRYKVANQLLMGASRDRQQRDAAPATETMDNNDEPLVATSTSVLQWYRRQQQQAATESTESSVLTSSSLALHKLLFLSENQLPIFLLQIMGPPASAKSQLCLDFAMHHASSSETASSKVLYLTTTTPPVSLARRLVQCISSKSSNRQAILKNVEFVSVSSVIQLLTFLHQTQTPSSHQGLLIIDSLSSLLIRDDVSFSNQQYIGLLLKQWALSGKVVYTSGQSASASSLGATWDTMIPFQRISLAVQSSSNNNSCDGMKWVRATTAQGAEADFLVDAKGIRDVDAATVNTNEDGE